MLRNSVEYNNPYEYEGGTPNLLPQKTNMFSFSLGWNDFQVMANYSIMKIVLCMYTIDTMEVIPLPFFILRI